MARQRSGEPSVGRRDMSLRPQRVRRRRRVLTLVAASGEEVRPVWIGEAVVALRQLSDLRRTVRAETGQNALIESLLKWPWISQRAPTGGCRMPSGMLALVVPHRPVRRY
jgi:hypothetical protein